jgi:hypothetical protein
VSLDPKLREEMINIMAPIIEAMESRYSEVLIAERLIDFCSPVLDKHINDAFSTGYEKGQQRMKDALQQLREDLY